MRTHTIFVFYDPTRFWHKNIFKQSLKLYEFDKREYGVSQEDNFWFNTEQECGILNVYSKHN
jgi:hypothetical protein